ncbi:hypothetical protein JZ751_027559 [Albula glossodonta]|uniref:Uncharacterized protein n=1 Tax=Albula glossodonta TaxID=121402 RepID=A0A8T2NDK4_9TELE|nr:hypothetical protein JZ751_027559 [Albula glossodonta]
MSVKGDDRGRLIAMGNVGRLHTLDTSNLDNRNYPCSPPAALGLSSWCLFESVPNDLTPEEQQELENIRRRKLELLEDIQRYTAEEFSIHNQTVLIYLISVFKGHPHP